MEKIQFEYINELAVLVKVGDEISIQNHQKVIGLYHFLKNNKLPNQIDLVPSYSSLGIYFDNHIYTLTHDLLLWVSQIFHDFELELHNEQGNKVYEIPVKYTGTDLPEVVKKTGLSKNTIIELHTQPEYTVAMLGFLPGFPYLLGLDVRLQIPRKAKPQQNVPKGSVAIGGLQTGIYPSESPGGWHIIGYTQTELFFKDFSQITLLKPGDKVKFYSI